jgi:hypothetical protein
MPRGNEEWFCYVLYFGLFPGVWCLITDVSEHCLFHLHRRVDMKCVKLDSLVVQAGTDRPSPLWGEGVSLQVAVRWWILTTGVVVRVSVLSEGRVGTLHAGGRCEAIVYFSL